MTRAGLFVAIVGPSGAGKDSLIRALAHRLADDPDFGAVRRVVTREADAHEDHDTLDGETFERLERLGRFALSWRAHGLRYGVPAQVDAALASGKTLVCNLSRGAVAEARLRWSGVCVALVTARPETLESRLAARGREGHGELRSRLARSSVPELALSVDVVIENDGELADAADRLYAFVQARRRVPA